MSKFAINNSSKKRVFWVTALLALAVVFVALGSICPAGAEEDDAASSSGISIAVTPVKSVLELDPGVAYDGAFEVTNAGAKAFDFNLSVKSYSVMNDDYEHSLEADTRYTQISRWISFGQTAYHLEAGETVNVFYHVDVPDNAPSGGQYAVILAQTEAIRSQDSLIDVSQQVGMLVFARIQGDVREEGRVISQQMDRFYFNPPMAAASRIENTGNIDFNATYKFTVQTLLGKTVHSETRENTISPETRRNVTMTWEQTPIIGIFKVNQEISFLGTSAAVSKIVVIMPIWMIVLLSLIMAAILFVIIISIKQKHKTDFHIKQKRRIP